MTNLHDIEDAILHLPAADRIALERWFYRRDIAGQAIVEDMPEDDRVEEPAAAYKARQEEAPLTVEEYLAFELSSEMRHEYVAGQLYAMTGASRSHNRIAGNLFNAFSNHLRGRPCEAFMTDFKVRLRAQRNEFLYYPDVMVVCERGTPKDLWTNAPKLIVEVLSPSTRSIDEREKRLNYQQIPTLEEYAIVPQTRAEITLYRRSEDWWPLLLKTTRVSAEFASIGLTVPLAQIFEGAL